MFRLTPESAIKTRLLLYLGSGLAMVWLVAATVSLALALHELNEAADSQMAQLARAVPTLSHSKTIILPEIEDTLGDDNTGDAEDDHNGLAVWDIRGRLLLADEKGRDIVFQTASGFIDTAPLWQRHSWRVLYLHHPESGQTVAVSQRWRERLATLLSVVWTQLAAALLALPLMGILLYLAVNHSLRPLHHLAADLTNRRADNLAPISHAVPQETQPLIKALNHLFARVRQTIEREQRFTADAAHELRSPLAALKVQADVLAISDADEHAHHLAHMRQSLERAEHLINQLLALARLDPEQTLSRREPVDWETLSGQVLSLCNLAAREKHIRLKRHIEAAEPLPLYGDPALLQLMLRNLIDNAVRYSPEHNEVSLHLYADKIEVRDHGEGIADEHLPRITERFYRPAGQNAQGSGLGLSIVEQIAKLHGLRLRLENRAEGGLSAWIERAD